jgi:hypothetical protein
MLLQDYATGKIKAHIDGQICGGGSYDAMSIASCTADGVFHSFGLVTVPIAKFISWLMG